MIELYSPIGVLLDSVPDELCDDCVEDLRTKKNAQVASNRFFHGPILIREENGYFVAKLPAFCHVGFGTIKMDNWKRQIHEVVKNQAFFGLNKPRGYACTTSPEIANRNEYEQKLSAIESATRDPDSIVAKFSRVWKKYLDAKFLESSIPARTDDSMPENGR